MSAFTLINRLAGVKPTGPGRWVARCPAHPDRSPSLSIRELEDGRVLIHDFAGCPVAHVLAALGLTLADLFPERLPGHSYPRSHSKIPGTDLLEIISEEVTLVALIGADMYDKRTISEVDFQRLAKAVARIGAARDHMKRFPSLEGFRGREPRPIR